MVRSLNNKNFDSIVADIELKKLNKNNEHQVSRFYQHFKRLLTKNMKKLFILTVLITASTFAYAQLKIGVNAGKPIGDYTDIYDFNAGLDVYYMFGKPDAFFKLGGATGFAYYF